MTDALYEYPFHLIEKYAEVKEEVLKRFSLSAPALITMSSVDDFYSFFNMDEDIYSLEDKNIGFEGFFNFDMDFELLEVTNRFQIGIFSFDTGRGGSVFDDYAQLGEEFKEEITDENAIFSSIFCDEEPFLEDEEEDEEVVEIAVKGRGPVIFDSNA